MPEFITWLIPLFCAGTIPWALTVQRKLAKLETQLETLVAREIPPEWFQKQVENNTARITALEQLKRNHD